LEKELVSAAKPRILGVNNLSLDEEFFSNYRMFFKLILNNLNIKIMKNLSKILFVLTAVFMFSCGEKKEEEETFTIGDEPRTESATTDTRSQTSAEEGVTEVVLTANDQMKFDKNEIRVQAGQTVRLTLEHVGQMEKNVMGHNFVLLEPGTNINEFGQRAVEAADNDYIPQNADEVIANTIMLGGGESDTIEFEAPEPGTYEFICSFPGHYAVMRGKFIVE